MTLSIPQVRHYLKEFELEKLFIEELGWDRHSGRLSVEADDQTFTLHSFAEKRGVQIFACQPDAEGKIPDYAVRRKIEKQVTKSAYEHLIIFIDVEKSTQIWQWVARQPGQPAAYREHAYHARYQSGDPLIQKLQSITFLLSEEEGLDLTGVTFQLRDAFDRDRVTKRFYDRFKKELALFLEFIKGIEEQGDKEWYASLMLNRLMFIYFIQRKSFLDKDPHYLRNRLRMVQQRKGKGKFLTFYRYFLLRLFHEGFSQQPPLRADDLEELLGEVPYLNGGLFELHTLEQRHTGLDIPDEAFEGLFDFFDQYEWHLDTRPLRNDREINPDVLGYIFEKYINQKQMGAYYTKEDITEYISKNTIIPYLFDAAEKKCAIAFQPDAALWLLLRDDPDRYIYPAVQKGVGVPLPREIARGIEDVSKREGWNRRADPAFALPTETWREHVARRQRCLELREKIAKGEIHQINDLITYNLDIRQFAEDAITGCEGPEQLRAFYQAISTVTVLDPTCGSGAFLFAALNILEPLYEACLDRMYAFVDDLDRSGERHRSEKFGDFQRILAEIDKHPSRRYFILKSIIVNNLYGVDIMEEAVEICKLRLFLKLVAQVDRVKNLEPLPDIDFNIRSGNTLVGFVSVDEIRRAAESDTIGQRQLVFGETQSAIQRIEEEAEIVERAFRKFHEMQTEQDMDARDFTAAKQELRERLNKLSDELDRYLAGEYGVNPDKKETYDQWRASHQPFHWFAEFYGIISRDGFDAIIGNPPYVEYAKVKQEYLVKGYRTEESGNLYAFVIERSLNILNRSASSGFIVPIALVSIGGNERLRGLLFDNISPSYMAHFAIRPAKLFNGVEQRLTIAIGRRSNHRIKETYSTKYNQWFVAERPTLFHRIGYTLLLEDANSPVIPKPCGSVGMGVLDKINSIGGKTIGDMLLPSSKTLIYFHRTPGYWIRVMDFLPFFKSPQGDRSIHHIRELPIALPKNASFVGSVLSSTLYFYWFFASGNCRNLTLEDVKTFPIGYASNIVLAKTQRLFTELMQSYRDNSEIKKRGAAEFQEFNWFESKSIIDEIDRVLAKHYAFTDEELDFIINYDIKYRMGQEEG